nr:hypothetical protein [Gongronella sp. w5]
MNQEEYFYLNKYNQIDDYYKPFKYAYKVLNKEMYLPSENLIVYTHNQLYQSFYNENMEWFNTYYPKLNSYVLKTDSQFKECINQYTNNLNEWINNIFLPDLKNVSELLNSDNIYLNYYPNNSVNYSLKTYYFNFAYDYNDINSNSVNKFITACNGVDDFINHLNYLLSDKLQFNVYKPKDLSLTNDYFYYVLNIKFK